MPDHCHALLSFPVDRSPAKVIRDWKHWAASQYGILWQVDFFEHRLRSDENLTEKWSYILQNPVRAGQVEAVEDWPHVWRAIDQTV